VSLQQIYSKHFYSKHSPIGCKIRPGTGVPPSGSELLRTLPNPEKYDTKKAILRSRRPLFVEPDVFHAGTIGDAVDHDRQPFHPRLPAGRAAVVKEDRSGAILRQLPFDLPDKLLAPLLVGLRGLSIDQLVGPIVLGRAAHVHPVLIIFSFLAGGIVLGVAGVILAVPVALVVKSTLATLYGDEAR